MQSIWQRPDSNIPKAEALVRVLVVYVLALFAAGLVLAFSDANPPVARADG